MYGTSGERRVLQFFHKLFPNRRSERNQLDGKRGNGADEQYLPVQMQPMILFGLKRMQRMLQIHAKFSWQ
jgi:hypothetical protein